MISLPDFPKICVIILYTETKRPWQIQHHMTEHHRHRVDIGHHKELLFLNFYLPLKFFSSLHACKKWYMYVHGQRGGEGNLKDLCMELNIQIQF